jgi:hypothetical protein
MERRDYVAIVFDSCAMGYSIPRGLFYRYDVTALALLGISPLRDSA